MRPFDNLYTDGVMRFCSSSTLNIPQKFHFHTLRHSCNGGSSNRNSSISSNISSNSTSTSSSSSFNILPFGQLKIPLLEFWKFQLDTISCCYPIFDNLYIHLHAFSLQAVAMEEVVGVVVLVLVVVVIVTVASVI